jgi:hypothetical protein
MITPRTPRFASGVLAACLCGLAVVATAQAPAPAAPAVKAPAAAEAASLEPLAWLAGCWQGAVNMRDFREQWMPLRGGMILGAGHTLFEGRTQSFEYLRLETRPDGVNYVVAPDGKGETAFRLVGQARDGDDEIFTFHNPRTDFPQTIIYRRGAKGRLFAHVEGKLNGADQRVIYPMRRVDCESGENIEK